MEHTYTYFPQRIYKINGEPAKTYGEWPGIKPNHWDGSLKVIRQNPTQKLFEEIVNEPIKKRRRFFSPDFSKEYSPFQTKKMFPFKKDLENIEEKKTGLKYLGEPKRPENTRLPGCKHFPPLYGKEKLPVPLCIKTFYPDFNACCDKELSLEKECGMKKRITSLHQKRNSLTLVNPGDNIYRLSEHSTGFFKEGGLIPGSTNRINRNKNFSKTCNNFYDGFNLNLKLLNDKKIWKNRLKLEALDTEIKYVNNLGEWEKDYLNLGDVKKEEKEIPKEREVSPKKRKLSPIKQRKK